MVPPPSCLRSKRKTGTVEFSISTVVGDREMARRRRSPPRRLPRASLRMSLVRPGRAARSRTLDLPRSSPLTSLLAESRSRLRFRLPGSPGGKAALIQARRQARNPNKPSRFLSSLLGALRGASAPRHTICELKNTRRQVMFAKGVGGKSWDRNGPDMRNAVHDGLCKRR